MRIAIFLTLIVLSTVQLSAQSFVVSPYLRYGLGELQTNTEAISFSMGGISMGLRNRYAINSFNPASYTVLTRDADSLPMLFNGGMKANYSNQKNLTQSSERFSGSLNSFGFGFKMARNWAMTLGLQPYSSVGYKLQTTTALDSVNNYTTSYEGSGGFYKLWMGHAVQLFDHLSVGVNASYIFGSLSQKRYVVFDTTAFYNAKTTSMRYVGDFAFDAGLQYEFILKRDSLKKEHTRLILGAAFGLPSKLNATEDMMAYRFGYSSGTEIIIDTTGQSVGTKGTISLPLYISGGFVFQKDKRWSFGADFKMQDWSGYTAFGESDSLNNSLSFHTGFSYTPAPGSKNRRKPTWYGGFHYDKSYLSLKGEELSKVGISFGCSFPLAPYFNLQSTTISTGIEIGRMGTTNQNLIEENYIRFVLGISLKERWFVKKKYN